MSPAQLTWAHKRHQRRQVQREMRSLTSMLAAVNTGNHGGQMAEERLRELKRELKALGNDDATVLQNGPKSQTPLSQDEFWRMFEEERSL